MVDLTPGRDLLEWIERLGLLVGDGAMGTQLQGRGLAPGECPEAWNLQRPGQVEAVHAGYLEAGAELLQTNSFGGSPRKLGVHGLTGKCREINRAAAEMARRVAGHRALVLGSIGPTGELLEPVGCLTEEEALSGFRRQAAALAEGGADALCVETMIDLREAVLATRAARATGLPVLVTLVFEAAPGGFFTIMGDAAVGAAGEIRSQGAAVVGANCVTGTEAMAGIIRSLRAGCECPVMIQPNAGLPVVGEGGVVYPQGPQEMAAAIPTLVAAGARIVGGCCGTTPGHVRRIAAEVRRLRGESPRL